MHSTDNSNYDKFILSFIRASVRIRGHLAHRNAREVSNPRNARDPNVNTILCVRGVAAWHVY